MKSRIPCKVLRVERAFWRALICSLAALGPPAGLAATAAPEDAVFARPGRLLPASDGAVLNFQCSGEGSPTVVFDSGWEDWGPAWSVVQPQVARWTRACAYDRAGVGFSSPGPLPRTSVRIAEELHSALKAGGIRGPYILVGHAFGSDNVRTFAELYLADVAAIVLVDGDVMDLQSRESRDKDHSGHVRAIAELKQCRDRVASGNPLPRLAAGGEAPRTCAQQFFRGIPEISWSSELNASVLKVAETHVALYEAFMSEMQYMPADEDYLQQHQSSYGMRPLRAITTGKHGVHVNDANLSEAQRRYADDAQSAQTRWLSRSSRGKEVVAQDSSEYVQFDRPGIVVDTLREVYELVSR